MQNHEYPDTARCDGMLTTDSHLYLVELKDQRENWQSEAKEQLLSTIDLMIHHHDLSGFRYKKAFACNRKRARFAYIENEENLKLFKKTGFRIDVQAEIIVV